MPPLQILDRTPVQSITDAIAVMTAIDEFLPDNDGVKWFNRLYLRVTTSVNSAVNGQAFGDTAFMTKLDVVFANQYFAALAAGSVDIRRAPSAWRPLLGARHQPGIARIQFALAGMTAHINRDLPDGIVQSFEAMGGDPLSADLRERDFESINEVLERVEAEVKVEFAIGLVGAIDRLGGQTDDAVAMWKVRAARSAAWTNAQVLWGLRRVPPLRNRFFDRLDGLVAMTGRGLLLPRVSF